MPLKDTFTLVVDGAKTELGVGGSIRFDNNHPLSVRNETNDTVTLIVVNKLDVLGDDR